MAPKKRASGAAAVAVVEGDPKSHNCGLLAQVQEALEQIREHPEFAVLFKEQATKKQKKAKAGCEVTEAMYHHHHHHHTQTSFKLTAAIISHMLTF